MRRAFALVFVACASRPAPAPAPDPSPPPAVSLEVPRMAEAVDTRPPPPPAATGATGDTNDISIDESPTPAATAPSRVSLDRGAAAAAIGNVLVGKCHVRGGPSGNGHITIDISPTGRISSAVVDTAPYVGTTVGSCVARLYMQQVKVPPFDGPPVRVGKSFTLP